MFLNKYVITNSYKFIIIKSQGYQNLSELFVSNVISSERVNLTENANALSLISTPSDTLCNNVAMKREVLKFGLDYQATCFYRYVSKLN